MHHKKAYTLHVFRFVALSVLFKFLFNVCTVCTVYRWKFYSVHLASSGIIWPFQWLLLEVHRLHGASGVRVPKSSREPWLKRHSANLSTGQVALRDALSRHTWVTWDDSWYSWTVNDNENSPILLCSRSGLHLRPSGIWETVSNWQVAKLESCDLAAWDTLCWQLLWLSLRPTTPSSTKLG